MPIQARAVRSLLEYIEAVKEDTHGWVKSPGCTPWFRGQRDSTLPPLPGILRRTSGIDERGITGRFLKLAPMLGVAPRRDMLDEWLAYMQHVGIPTRLLDWSEGALLGLYFAVREPAHGIKPGVWVLDPLALNRLVLGRSSFPEAADDQFMYRCDLAFGTLEESSIDITWPVAIVPMHSHPRMRSQRGCFTLHGKSAVDFEEVALRTGIYEAGSFLKYEINCDAAGILRDLRLLGISHSTLFPDHDGLAVDLKIAFQQEHPEWTSEGQDL